MRKGRARSVVCQITALAGVFALTAGDYRPFVAQAHDGRSELMRGGLAQRAEGGKVLLPPNLGISGSADKPLAGDRVRMIASRAHPRTEGDLGIPSTVLDAYQRAADQVAKVQPDCHLTWAMLAGIGKIESGHANGGNVSPNGDVLDPIYGPALDGTDGTAAIGRNFAGPWGYGGVWARAMGPMQFIPSSWSKWGVDGNGDDFADPQNVYDAALSAGRYLCAGGRDLATWEGLHAALLSYNHSEEYVDNVLRWVRVYESGAVPIPDDPHGSGRETVFRADATSGTVGAPTDDSFNQPPPTRPAPSEHPPAAEPPPAEQPTPQPAPGDGHEKQPEPAPSPQPVLKPVGDVVDSVGEVLIGSKSGSTASASQPPSPTSDSLLPSLSK